MKKISSIAIVVMLAFCCFALTNCGSSSDDGGGKSTDKNRLVGEWHLKSWNGLAPQEFDAYLVFSAGGTFEIYQRIEEVRYQRFAGSYLFADKALSGTYDDQTPWGAAYSVAFDESGDTLTLTSASPAGEVSVYVRASVPASVKESAAGGRSVPDAMPFRLL